MYDARLSPTEGSEQAGIRPVIIVTRDAINTAGNVIIAVPCTTYHPGQRVYPSQTVVRAPNGGLTSDSVAMGEQVRALSKSRLLRRRGMIDDRDLARLERALLIALDLPGQPGRRNGTRRP